MKKAGQILKELGFREDAPDSLKEAFVRHLIKSATGQVVEPGPHEKKELIQKTNWNSILVWTLLPRSRLSMRQRARPTKKFHSTNKHLFLKSTFVWLNSLSSRYSAESGLCSTRPFILPQLDSLIANIFT
jgi:hypothetical protein